MFDLQPEFNKVGRDDLGAIPPTWGFWPCPSRTDRACYHSESPKANLAAEMGLRCVVLRSPQSPRPGWPSVAALNPNPQRAKKGNRTTYAKLNLAAYEEISCRFNKPATNPLVVRKFSILKLYHFNFQFPMILITPSVF